MVSDKTCSQDDSFSKTICCAPFELSWLAESLHLRISCSLIRLEPAGLWLQVLVDTKATHSQGSLGPAEARPNFEPFW